MRFSQLRMVTILALLALGSSCSVFKKLTENPLQKIAEKTVEKTVGKVVGDDDDSAVALVGELKDAAQSINAEQEHYLGLPSVRIFSLPTRPLIMKPPTLTSTPWGKPSPWLPSDRIPTVATDSR